MNRIVLTLLALPLFSATAMAQVATPAPTPSSAVTAPSPVPAPMPGTIGTNTATAPTVGGASGENSFTESQARARLEQNGYSNVSSLTQDPNGVWRGTALRNGTTVAIGLDYKGNISTN